MLGVLVAEEVLVGSGVDLSLVVVLADVDEVPDEEGREGGGEEEEHSGEGRGDVELMEVAGVGVVAELAVSGRGHRESIDEHRGQEDDGRDDKEGCAHEQDGTNLLCDDDEADQGQEERETGASQPNDGVGPERPCAVVSIGIDEGDGHLAGVTSCPCVRSQPVLQLIETPSEERSRQNKHSQHQAVNDRFSQSLSAVSHC